MSRIKNPKLPYIHKVIITAISSFVVLLILWPSDKPEPSSSYPEGRYEIGKFYSVPIQTEYLVPQKNDDPNWSADDYLDWEIFTIRSGESLAMLFDSVGITPNILHRLIATDKHTKSLASLKVGDEIQLGFDYNGQFTQLIHPQNIYETLIVTLEDNKFTTRITSKRIEKQHAFASATIKSSFWAAGIKAGLKPNQIMDLAALFAWDIDFALDIRSGDSFSVLYENKYIDGEVIGQGEILAATFTNQGDTYTTIYHQPGEYYNEKGLAMRKTFLRSPVNFRYVSSNFNPNRLHPVTGKVRAHRGTDYVAPVGTPIWAAGNGVVTMSGYNQYNGNYVFIRHNSTYDTKYLHLTKRFVKTGERVKQGQKIGTLGGTGRVTGPHLHYEFLVNGTHQNPRTVQLPKARSIYGAKKKQFMRSAKARMIQLKRLSQLFVSTDTNSIDVENS